MPKSDLNALREVGANVMIDGFADRKHAQLRDGYLSVAELESAIAFIGSLLGRKGPSSRLPEDGPLTEDARIVYELRLEVLHQAVPLAQAAQDKGEPGLAYMDPEFYRFVKSAGLTAEEVSLSVDADRVGNQNGKPIVEEVHAFVRTRPPMPDATSTEKVSHSLLPKLEKLGVKLRK